MSLLDDEDDLVNNNVCLVKPIAEKIIDNLISPLLQKLGSTEPMPRIGMEVNRNYTLPFVGSGGVTKYGVSSISIRECLDKLLGDKNKLQDGINSIDCSKVNRMGEAVDFVITALINNSPIILIENITELPDSPRRKDIEGVLIHSWAKSEFVFLDNVYDSRSHIVIFTSRPSNEIESGYYPVWDNNDHYQWYGNILKDISTNGVIDEEQFDKELLDK